MNRWLLIVFVLLSSTTRAQTGDVWERRQLNAYSSALFPARYDSLTFGGLTILNAEEDSIRYSISYGLPDAHYRKEITSMTGLRAFYKQLIEEQNEAVEDGELLDSSTFWQDSLLCLNARFYLNTGGEPNNLQLRATYMNDQMVSLTVTYPEDGLNDSRERSVRFFLEGLEIHSSEDLRQLTKEDNQSSLMLWMMIAVGGLLALYLLLKLSDKSRYQS